MRPGVETSWHGRVLKEENILGCISESKFKTFLYFVKTQNTLEEILAGAGAKDTMSSHKKG